jgi:hypothetical protein
VEAVLRRVLPWVGLVALLVVVVATVDWHNTPAPVPVSRHKAPAEKSLSAQAARRLIRNAALVRGDLPRGYRATSENRLLDPSLVLCGITFDNEGARLATYHAAFLAPGGGHVRSVVIAFQPDYAAWALSEIEAAAAICARPVRPSAEQQPDLLALRVRTIRREGPPRQDLVVERRGDVLSLLEVDDRLDRLTLPLARRLSRRLEARLPD